MKVIFLDNDGVICLSNNWGSRYKKRKKELIDNSSKLPVNLRLDDFDKKAINVLNQILEESKAEIVVSSDWKLHANLEELGEYYLSQGIIKKPIGITPNLSNFDPDKASLFTRRENLGRARIFEIKKYLEEHPEISNWVAVDDLEMGQKFYSDGLDFFVHCPRSSEGIKQIGVKEKILMSLQ
jgi:hypothetical protein